MHQKYINTRKTVEARLYRVRNSLVGDLRLINHGRDTCGLKIHADTWTALSSFNHPLERARGEHANGLKEP